MNPEKFPAINVLTVMRGFQNRRLPHQITPYRFETQDGRRFKVKTIRQTHKERVGHGFHVHYVIQTDELRFFHLVMETETFVWRIIQEVDDELFFNP
ncbi:MAG: hypothetical protein RI513_03015 [Balneolaceae bacterium]|nr:hypothetical protein [Balneolaceae bacterium]MDR9446111.1 hypothetical protein [Balneolaceae bacterium]